MLANENGVDAIVMAGQHSKPRFVRLLLLDCLQDLVILRQENPLVPHEAPFAPASYGVCKSQTTAFHFSTVHESKHPRITEHYHRWRPQVLVGFGLSSVRISLNLYNLFAVRSPSFVVETTSICYPRVQRFGKHVDSEYFYTRRWSFSQVL